METFFILLIVMDAWLYTLLPVRVTVFLKYMHFVRVGHGKYFKYKNDDKIDQHLGVS